MDRIEKENNMFWGLSGYMPAICCVMLLAAVTATQSIAAPEDDRKKFLEAHKSLKAGNLTKFNQLANKLQDYSLYPYLELGELRRRLGTASDDEIAGAIAKYSEIPLADDVRREWLQILAQRKRWSTFLTHYTPQSSHKFRCWEAQARLDQGESFPYTDVSKDLWVIGKSQVDECDPVFAHWRKTNQLNHGAYWQRTVAALSRGNVQLARYLKPKLNPRQQQAYDHWVALSSRPSTTLAAAIHWTDTPENREAVLQTMRILARRSNVLARKHWPDLRKTFSFTADEVAHIDQDIAVYYASDYPKDGLDVLLNVPATSTDNRIREWRVRLALLQPNWDVVKREAGVLAQQENPKDRWRYWYARGLAETGQSDEANAVLDELARETSFFGFAAAERMRLPPSVCPKTLSADPSELRATQQIPGVARALELYAIDWETTARRELNRALADAPPETTKLVAQLTHDAGWHHQTILLLAGIAEFKYYDLRFPQPYPSILQSAVQANGTDASLALAIMRAESALAEEAQSGANALGLMQLTLPTAKQVAKRAGVRVKNKNDLFDPEKNIRLGTTNLARLFEEQQHPLKVLAAYNAGPGAVKRWEKLGLPLEADRWMETVPYFETRDYFSRVLAFTMLYDWQRSGKTRPIGIWLPDLDQRGPRKVAASAIRAPECRQL